MADVRNLLRNERASRRVSHPYASYSKSGQLLCSICQLFIKSESLWDGHLRSPNHKKNVQKAQNGGSTLEPISKKRKLDDDEANFRKKSRGDNEVQENRRKANHSTQEEGPQDPDGTVEAQEAPDSNALVERTQLQASKADTKPHSAEATMKPAPLETKVLVDEDEWAAFEREVVPLTHDPIAAPNQFESATISAAPMTAAEVAAQQEASNLPRKEEEIEGEREDEERRMEDEFEVMEEMEERVKRLKERREALRFDHKLEAGEPKGASTTTALGVTEVDPKLQNSGVEIQDRQLSDKDSEDDGSDFDGWALR